MKELAAKGVEVVGVSGDSVRTQQLFKKVHELNYTLLADEDGAVARKFGVPVGKGGSFTKEIDGVEETITRGVTPSRWSFVIGKDGKIAAVNRKVNAAKESKAILKIIEGLPGSLELGDAVPDFEVRDDTDKAWRWKDHVGKKTLVLFSFPAALTGG